MPGVYSLGEGNLGKKEDYIEKPGGDPLKQSYS